MLSGLRACGRGLRHFNHRGYLYIWGNILWVLLSLPIITAPAAWAGLVKMSYRLQTAPGGDVNDLMQGFRQNLRRGLVLAAANLVIIGLNVVNLIAYSGQEGAFLALLRAVWILALAAWVVVQFYLWPLFYEMRQPTLQGALRNAAVMVLLNPGFTLGLWLGVALLVVLSTVFALPWLLLTGGALASVTTAAVLDRLESAGLREPTPEDVPDIVEFEE